MLRRKDLLYLLTSRPYQLSPSRYRLVTVRRKPSSTISWLRAIMRVFATVLLTSGLFSLSISTVAKFDSYASQNDSSKERSPRRRQKRFDHVKTIATAGPEVRVWYVASYLAGRRYNGYDARRYFSPLEPTNNRKNWTEAPLRVSSTTRVQMNFFSHLSNVS